MGHEVWHSDIDISNEFVEDILSKQFPEIKLSKIKCIGEGWDNKVFLINNQLIFRFPHRKIAAELIVRENKILGSLQGLVNLKIPYPVYRGKPDKDYPYYFHGYKVINGQSSCSVKLSNRVRRQSIDNLAEFLRKLHGINESEARAMGATEQVFDRTNFNLMQIDLIERVEKINTCHTALLDLNVVNDEIATAEKITLPSKKVLVHGDLYSRHLLFDDNKLVGIIDWGDVGINNPAVDLSIIFSFYSNDCHESFFKIYGEVDTETYSYSRFLGIYSALTIMLYGYDTGDNQLVHEAKESIRRINKKIYCGCQD